MDRKRLSEMRDKYKKEVETLRAQLQQAINAVNQLQTLLVDRQSKVEVLEELLKDDKNV